MEAEIVGFADGVRNGRSPPLPAGSSALSLGSEARCAASSAQGESQVLQLSGSLPGRKKPHSGLPIPARS